MNKVNRARASFVGALAAISLGLFAAGCDGGGKGQEGKAAAKSAAVDPAKGKPAAAPPVSSIKEPAPAVPNVAEAKKYAGAKITFYGDSVGIAAELDKVMVARFSQDTGIEVRVVPRPKDATESYATYQRLFQAKSPDVDVLSIDVIWPGAFAHHLLDLGTKLGEAAAQHLPRLVENNKIGGALVAVPWFTDFGMLYYRTDLLQKHGYQKPPETWDELEAMAKKVVDAEKAANPSLVGFVWQGKAYEGLTCNAVEWFFSHGAGTILEDGKPTVKNAAAEKALGRARGWIGGISPAGVTGYEEEDARNVFQAGNAVFMRNWPYAYSLGNDERSPVKGKFDVAPLPHEAGQKSGGAAGGWQLAVSKYSKSPDAAIELVRYLTSPEAQKYRAVVGSFVPTIPAVQADPDVAKKLPFLQKVASAEVVPRPSRSAGERYNEISIAFFQGVSQALQGKEPKAVVDQIDARIQRAVR